MLKEFKIVLRNYLFGDHGQNFLRKNLEDKKLFGTVRLPKLVYVIGKQ